jgi:hypothetical protein
MTIKLIDLFDLFVLTQNPEGRVLIFVNIEDSSRDLIDRIEIILDPSEDDIEEVSDRDIWEVGLYEDGKRV